MTVAAATKLPASSVSACSSNSSTDSARIVSMSLETRPSFSWARADSNTALIVSKVVITRHAPGCPACSRIVSHFFTTAWLDGNTLLRAESASEIHRVAWSWTYHRVSSLFFLTGRFGLLIHGSPWAWSSCWGTSNFAGCCWAIWSNHAIASANFIFASSPEEPRELLPDVTCRIYLPRAFALAYAHALTLAPATTWSIAGSPGQMTKQC